MHRTIHFMIEDILLFLGYSFFSSAVDSDWPGPGPVRIYLGPHMGQYGHWCEGGVTGVGYREGMGACHILRLGYQYAGGRQHVK